MPVEAECWGLSSGLSVGRLLATNSSALVAHSRSLEAAGGLSSVWGLLSLATNSSARAVGALSEK